MSFFFSSGIEIFKSPGHQKSVLCSLLVLFLVPLSEKKMLKHRLQYLKKIKRGGSSIKKSFFIVSASYYSKLMNQNVATFKLLLK